MYTMYGRTYDCINVCKASCKRICEKGEFSPESFHVVLAASLEAVTPVVLEDAGLQVYAPACSSASGLGAGNASPRASGVGAVCTWREICPAPRFLERGLFVELCVGAGSNPEPRIPNPEPLPSNPEPFRSRSALHRRPARQV